MKAKESSEETQNDKIMCSLLTWKKLLLNIYSVRQISDKRDFGNVKKVKKKPWPES